LKQRPKKGDEESTQVGLQKFHQLALNKEKLQLQKKYQRVPKGRSKKLSCSKPTPYF